VEPCDGFLSNETFMFGLELIFFMSVQFSGILKTKNEIKFKERRFPG
jgi:hypothetical protein